MKIAILTDSSFDGNAKSIKDLYKVPLMIVDESGKTYLDDDNFLEEDFYDLLKNQALKTSQTNPGLVLEKWDELLDSYDQIIFCPLSKGLSGQFNTFRMLSETENKYKGKVFVCDTNGVSVIQHRMIIKVAHWISENKTGFEILEKVSAASKQFTAYIIPSNLETLKRGGRISPAAAALARMLKIVPILKYDGIIDKEDTTRTFKKAVVESIAKLKKKYKNMTIIDITYSRCDKEQIQIVKEIIEKEGFKIGLENKLSKVIVAHTGEGTFAIGTWGE